jgi:nucleoside-triphosphatase THEP1/molybdopterin converting factor small subunit
MVLNEGKVAGYDLFHLKDGDSTPFLRKEGEAGWQRVGPYFFLPRGLEAATAAILGCKPGEILIVDEVGPAELAGRGVWPALSEVIAKHSVDCLLVVRKPLLEDLRRRIRREPVRVFNIEREGVYHSLLQALSRWKVRREVRRNRGMMIIKVRFFGPFQESFGGREAEIGLRGHSGLGELLERVCDTPGRVKQVFAVAGVLHPHVVVMKNGVPVQSPGGLEERLRDGDVIAIFPFLGGG